MPNYKIIVLDPLAEEGLQALKAEKDIEVEVKLKLPPEEIKKIIGGYDAAIVRSETKLTADVLEAGKKLKIVGRAGVGLDNIDIAAATQRGIIVTNSPDANTLSTAELTMSMILALSRKIVQADASLRAGKWERSKFTGVELYDKTLGIVGLGRIGKEVAKRAMSFGMQVIGYDPYVTEEQAKKVQIELVPMEEIIKRSDFITVHVPLTKDTTKLFGAKEMSQMKKGVRLINCARGGIYDEKALFDALQSGQVAGVALDVYEKEPPVDNPLLTLANVVVVPHLGASTEEAQKKVGKQIAEQIIAGLKGGPNLRAVNVPSIDPVLLKELKPYLDLTEKLGRFIAQLAEGPIKTLKIVYSGDVLHYDLSPLTVSGLKGVLEVQIKEAVNFVNAGVIAKQRGLEVVESRSTQPTDYSSLISFKAEGEGGKSFVVSGTLHDKKDPRFVNINGYDTDVEPTQYMIVLSHLDKPGIVGHLGTILGAHQVNIAGLYVGREKIGGKAVAVLTVDTEVSGEVLGELSKHKNIEKVRLVRM